MRKLAEIITNGFVVRGIIYEDDYDAYIYGFDSILYTLFSTFGLLAIGCLAASPFETTIAISVFYINQTLGGGFHASTHLKCFIAMVVWLIVFLLIMVIVIPLFYIILIAFFSFQLLLKYPLVLHKNKQYLNVSRVTLVMRSRIALLIQMFIFIVLLCIGNIEYSQCIAIALALCAFSRIIARFQNGQ